MIRKLDTKSMIQQRKNKLNFIKVKNLCSVKDFENKKTTQCTDWKKLFINHIANKWLVYWIYKGFLKLKSKKIQLENGKWHEQTFQWKENTDSK